MRTVRFVTLILALGAASSVSAGPPPEAAKLFRKCVAEFEAGRHATARTCFVKVYTMYRSPVVLFNLARTEEALGNLVEAADAYRRCAADRSGTLTAEERADVLQRTELILKRLGLVVLPELPQGSVVLVDGRTRNHTIPGGITVLPGDHEIRIESPRMRAHSERISIAAGEIRKLDFVLAPAEVPPAEEPAQDKQAAPAPETQPQSAPAENAPAGIAVAAPDWARSPVVRRPVKRVAPGRGLRASGYTLGSLGLTTLIVGAVAGGLAMQTHNDAKPHCSTVVKDLCDPEGVDLTAKAYNLALLSTVAIVAGSTVLVTGIVLASVGHAQGRRARRVSVVPAFGPAFGGLTVQGGF